MVTWQKNVSELLNESLTFEWFVNSYKLFITSPYFDVKKNVMKLPNVDRKTTKKNEFVTADFFDFSIHGVATYNYNYSQKLEKLNFIPLLFIHVRLWQDGIEGIKTDDIFHNYRWIKKFMAHISDCLSELIDNTTDRIYSLYLQTFEINLNRFLLHKFQRIIDEYEEAYQNLDRLEFDLNQDELGALLYLIQHFVSGVNSDNRKGKIDFHTFCNRYFYYNKGKDFAPIKNVSKKISEAKTGENHEALEKVFGLIKTAHRRES
jgi:hypothetical protein